MFKKFFQNKNLLIRILVLVVIGFLYVSRSLNDFDTPFVEGDGQEYVLTTEAICNHLTPDVRASDVESFKAKFDKVYGWDKYYLRETQDYQIEAFKRDNHPFKGNIGGLYFAKDKSWYSQHFFLYSYINAPAYLLFSKSNPIRPFYFMNAILVLLACYFILFKTPFSLINSVLAALCFCFSSAYWYLNWEHTEILSMSLVTISLIVFFNKRNFASLVIMALACMQTQPLNLLFGFMSLMVLLSNGLNVKNLVKVFATGLITLIPSLFYFLKFDTTNIIKDAGFLDTMYITFNRVSGFFFDFNQGMILTIPLILLVYVIVIAKKYITIIKNRRVDDLSVFIPFVLIAITAAVSTMGNWNHGMAIINRYASWMSCVVIIHLFYMINEWKHEIGKLVLYNYFFCTQCITTLYHQQFNEFDWSSGFNTPLAKWAYTYHPGLYNPDPVIFAGRLRIQLSEENSPIIYFRNRAPKKIMVHRKHINKLRDYGVTEASLERIKNDISYNYDWGYINMLYFKTSLSNEQIYGIKRKLKVDAVKEKILGSKIWSDQIREKAAHWGKTFEEAVDIDAEFMVSEDERKQVDD